MKRIKLLVFVPFVSGMLVSLGAACRPSGTTGSRDEWEESFSTLEERMALKLGFSCTNLSPSKYQPLADYLTPRTPFRFEIRLARSQEDAMAFLEERIAEVVELDPVTYVRAHEKFGAIPLVRPLGPEGEPLERALFLTAPDGAIRCLADVRGKKLALGPPHSALTSLLARAELQRAGVRLEEVAMESLFDDEAVLRAIATGRADVGVVSESAFQASSRTFFVVHRSARLSRSPLAVRSDLPATVRDALARAFLSAKPEDAPRRQDWERGLAHGFVPASDADYDAVRKLLRTSGKGCAKGCHGILAYSSETP